LTEINTQLVIYAENLKELQENEAKQCTTQHLENVYSFIDSTLSREGVKLHLLEHYLPQISSTVNRIVSEFIEREIKLFIEDGQLVFQSIKSFAKDNDHHVKVHGGMETFILDLAFKIAFSQFSESPKCNMLIIDERLSVLDKEHRDNIEDILNFLRTNYLYTFIIAHEQKLKDSTTSNIYITQDENKISTIKQL
jgi:DNA repair exonuclease SbcCD ATPase subunit